MNVKSTRVLIALSALALGMSVASPPASAEPTDTTSRVVDQALKSMSAVDPASPRLAVDGATVTRPTTDKVGAVIGENGRGSALTIALENDRRPRVSLADSDSSTYQNVADDTDAEVRVVPDGAQLFSVIRDASESSQQRYRIRLPAGSRLARLADGGYLVQDSVGNPVGRIEAPWAVDATGRRLPTSYTWKGGVLVQSTDTSNAKFPVVADPKVTYGLSIYVRWQRSEVKALKSGGKLIGAAALVAAACGAIPVTWLKIACGGTAAGVGHSLLSTFTTAANKNRCVQITFSYQGLIQTWTTKTRGSWCR